MSDTRLLCVGYFDDPSQTIPAFDPGADAGCAICGGHGLTNDNCRTHSIMLPGTGRSYFYRTHRACADDQDSSEQTEHEIVEALIARHP